MRGTMPEGRAIIESSSFEGALKAIECLQHQFHYISATIPVKSADGKYLSSVIYSNDITIMKVHK